MSVGLRQRIHLPYNITGFVQCSNTLVAIGAPLEARFDEATIDNTPDLFTRTGSPEPPLSGFLGIVLPIGSCYAGAAQKALNGAGWRSRTASRRLSAAALTR